MSSARSIIENNLRQADIRINGTRPWDIQVHDERFFGRCLAYGSLGVGESYMDGWWDVERIDELFSRVLRRRVNEPIKPLRLVFSRLAQRLFNLQKGRRAYQIGKRHYDIGNDLYERMLGKSMAYSCAYWEDAETLDEAQERKFELTCRKLDIRRGMTVLDIGCGWGGLARYIAEKCDARVVGITVSEKQADWARKHCAQLPVEIRYQDYRDIEGRYDRIVSIGMFEHVGHKNYRRYMEVVRDRLSDDGLFLLHTIGGNTTTKTVDPWIERYIFPNSMLPSIRQIGAALEDRFVMEDWHNLSTHYDRTLMAWYENLADYWPEIRRRYGERFCRMWRFYLLSCAGAFRSRQTQVWQILLSKGVATPPKIR